VDTSRFWFNYRHAANVYSMYRTIKKLGIPDSHIILMVADGMACDAQNPLPAQVYNDERRSVNVYGTEIEVDYRGYEVTAEALMRVLTGRHAETVPHSKRLLSDAGSNVFIYLTGHGGDGFFKFQDAGEISSYDLADAFQTMYQKGRYHELMVLVDTCEANTLQEQLYSPGVLMAGAARKDENSWSKGSSATLGTTLVDRFTDSTLNFFERRLGNDPSLEDLLQSYDSTFLDSHPGWKSSLSRPLSAISVYDFFGSKVRHRSMPASPARSYPTPLTPVAPPAPVRRSYRRQRHTSEDQTLFWIRAMLGLAAGGLFVVSLIFKN
jgi:phosphatidylinositol glycan class K